MIADPVVSTAWLAQHLGDPDLRVLDAPFYLPGDPRTPRGEFETAHIAGAQLFDLEAIKDHANPLPHMLASPEAFAAAVGALGVGSGDTVVVYDHIGIQSSARVWWNFRIMGHDKVHVLDGGLPRWLAEGRPVVSGPAAPVEARAFAAHRRPELVRSVDEVKAALADGQQVLDARSAGRFSGSDAEPRAGLSSGHMPGARNLPFGQILKDGGLIGAEALKPAFEHAGIDLDQPVITSCGSGVTAAVLALGLARLGRWDAAVYDGSWTEWASRDDTPIVKD